MTRSSPLLARAESSPTRLLDDVGDLIRGVSYKPQDIRPGPGPDAVALLRATNIQDGSLLTHDVLYVDCHRVTEIQRLHRWDVLIAMSSGSTLAVGKLAQLPDDWNGSFGAFCAVLRPRSNIIDPQYFGFVVQSGRFRERIELLAQGTNIKNLSKHHLLGFPFKLPPIEEQRRIVRILATIQRSKRAAADVLRSVQKLKVAFKRHFLEQQLRAVTPVHLGDLKGIIETGPFGSQLHASEYAEDGIRVLNPMHLCENGVNPGAKPVFISEETAARLVRHRLQDGDVVVPRRGDLSRYVLIRGNLVGDLCGTGSIKVRLNDERISPAYFALYFGSEPAQAYLRDAATGSIMPNISPNVLERMPIAIPSRTAQDQAVQGWEAIDGIERASALRLGRLDLVFSKSLALLLGEGS